MTVTYIIHRYAGTAEDRTVTVTGRAAELVMQYAGRQAEVGITILSIVA